MTATILKFDRAQRRASFARLATGYIDVVATTILLAKMDDGEVPGQVRDMTADERRNSAIYLTSQFFVSVLGARAALEPEGESGPLRDIVISAIQRIASNWNKTVGTTHAIVTDPGVKNRLLEAEKGLVTGIFQALQLEAPSDDFMEFTFWLDVFRGFSDADVTGILHKSAHTVLLHHTDGFRQALDACVEPASTVG